MTEKRHDGVLWALSVGFFALMIFMIVRGSFLAAVLCFVLAIICNPVTVLVLDTRGKLKSKKAYIAVAVLITMGMVISAIAWPKGVDKNHVCYWTQDGKSYHFTKDCPTLGKSDKITKGKVKDALKNGHDDPCNICADGK